MITNVQRVVKNLKGITFLQPVYEAVNNALEADATKIKVFFHSTRALFAEKEVKRFVVGVTIEDNGKGFNRDNVQSFCEYLTDKKASLGCKGVGRFTWLKVFKRAQITSQIAIPQGYESLQFVFDFGFTNIFASDLEKSRQQYPQEIKENKTRISLEGVSSAYFDPGKHIFHVPEANLEQLTEHIRIHLLPNLILLKKRGNKFCIEVYVDENPTPQIIDWDHIPDVQEQKFTIEASVVEDQKESIPFDLLMHIEKDGKGLCHNYFCANNRTVTSFEAEDLKIIIPERGSSIMLLSSPYLDDRVNPERNGFIGIKPKSSDLASPLSWEDIKGPLVNNISQEINKLYPEVKQTNDDKLDALIEENPYLVKYLRSEKQNIGILNTDDILKRSKKRYEEDKEKIQKTFLRALDRNKADSAPFKAAVSGIQEISMFELSRYIMYRQNIIKALNKVSEDADQPEENLHSLFMQMLSSTQGDHYLDSNLWLFDDRYMTYDYAASDCSIKRIFNELKEKYPHLYAGREPDMAVFYSTPEQGERKDLVIVEFKKPQATRQEKDISITEIANNVAIFRKNMPALGQIWNYIVTKIDDPFEETLKSQDFQPLFSPGTERIYYKYYKYLQTHCYAISLEAIIHDSNLRNKTFLDILTGKKKGPDQETPSGTDPEEK